MVAQASQSMAERSAGGKCSRRRQKMIQIHDRDVKTAESSRRLSPIVIGGCCYSLTK
jgi:hypothetical protein